MKQKKERKEEGREGVNWQGKGKEVKGRKERKVYMYCVEHEQPPTRVRINA